MVNCSFSGLAHAKPVFLASVFCFKAFAVNAPAFLRLRLVSSYCNRTERAVVFIAVMIFTISNRTAYALVYMRVINHFYHLCIYFFQVHRIYSHDFKNKKYNITGDAYGIFQLNRSYTSSDNRGMSDMPGNSSGAFTLPRRQGDHPDRTYLQKSGKRRAAASQRGVEGYVDGQVLAR